MSKINVDTDCCLKIRLHPSDVNAMGIEFEWRPYYPILKDRNDVKDKLIPLINDALNEKEESKGLSVDILIALHKTVMFAERNKLDVFIHEDETAFSYIIAEMSRGGPK